MMKQHYLPQFYLKGFCDKNSPSNHEPYLWTYELSNNCWKKKAPKNIGYISELYTIKSANKEDKNKIENKFSELESKVAIIIDDKIKRKQDINIEEREWLSFFVSLFLTRVPYFLEYHETFLNNLVEQVALDRASKDLGLNLDTAAFEEIFGEININKDYIARTSLLGVFISPNLLKMKWAFFHRTDGFISSDFPCNVLNYKLIGTGFENGLITKNASLVFPISSDIALLAFWSEEHPLFQHYDAEDQIVEEINQRVYSFAQNFIISSKNSFLGDEVLRR